MKSTFRIGIGYDLHRLKTDRPLVLGGLTIPFHLGLDGHSDADVVLHALTDALLGAAGLPDIGECFPDTDPQYANADSRDLLARVMHKLRAQGYQPINVDLVIHAEQPKLGPHKRPMAEVIAGLLKIETACVSVKAKTNEGVDAVGRGEAIACTAAVLIARELDFK